MPSRVVSRPGRRWEGRVGERTDRDDDEVLLRRLRVEDLRAAVGAEVEDVLLPVGLVGRAAVVAEVTDDIHLIRLEPRLHPERAPGPALTGEAVTDRDGKRLARHLQAELPAVACSLPLRDRGGSYQASGRVPSSDPPLPLQEALPAEEREEPGEHRHHQREDRPERPEGVVTWEAHV